MDIELTYDMVGTRLRGIGDATITYDRLGSRPRTLGSWKLEYDRLGTRLRAVSTAEITYSRWAGLPRTVGQWSCEHSKLASRLLRIGPHELRYDQLCSRVRAIGSLEIFYDRLGTRPNRVRLPGEGELLSDDLLLALFLVLYWQEEQERQTAARRGGVGVQRSPPLLRLRWHTINLRRYGTSESGSSVSPNGAAITAVSSWRGITTTEPPVAPLSVGPKAPGVPGSRRRRMEIPSSLAGSPRYRRCCSFLYPRSMAGRSSVVAGAQDEVCGAECGGPHVASGARAVAGTRRKRGNAQPERCGGSIHFFASSPGADRKDPERTGGSCRGMST